MQYSLAALAFGALAVANPLAQAPATAAASSCSPSYSGSFEIEILNVTSSSKRAVEKRAALQLTLNNGVLKDAQGRVGYIASNRQFQFDYSVDGGPPQTGAIYTEGWAVCSNQTLVLGPDAVFQECLSGTFYNLYDESTAAQCNAVYIHVINGNSAASPVSQQADGQPTGLPVTQITDGQIQNPTGNPVTQITDGQIQAPTGNPVTQISDGQIQAPTGNPVTQISDGQIQAPTGKPVTQISDGQIQAPTGKPVTQISDGQIQAPTGNPVTQISDGQIQAPTGRPVTQISDGQIQAPTGRPVSQISDGQIQAPTGRNGSVATPTVQAYTGAAATPAIVRGELFGLAAGVLAVAML